jgi:hypothetical protein
VAGGESEETQERALARPPAPLGTAPESLGTSRPEARRRPPTSELALLTAPRGEGARSALRSVVRSRWAPLVALSLLLAFSVASKSVDLSQPCKAPCKVASSYAPCKAESSHTLIFDESYYVNAARVIDGIEPPAGCPYRGDPKGDDPNAEHPQLAKLVIAAGIDVFGDNALGWRIGSIVFSAIALLALYALVRAAGGSSWLAVGAAAVMSLDNLMLVHGRIATLDVYAVAMMLIAGVLYMRRHPLLAGLAVGVAACMKEVALFLLFAFILLEALRMARGWAATRRERALPATMLPRAGTTMFTDAVAATPAEVDAAASANAAASAASNAGAATAMTAAVPSAENEATTEYDAVPASAAGPPANTAAPDVEHAKASASTSGEIRYGSRRGLAFVLVSEHVPPLIIVLISGVLATLGLLWLLDVLVPAYDPGTHVVYNGDPFAHLAHMYNYALLLKSKPNETGITSSPLAWLLDEKAINYAKVAVNTLVNGKIVGSHATISFQGVINPFIIFLAIPALFAALAAAWKQNDDVAALGACWCLGTYLPFLIGDLSSGRVSYIYYMLLAMPGIYIVTTRLFASRRVPTAATVGWAIVLIYGFIHLYPIRTLL